jgi:peptidoglycan/xylan/chitin deacetylase (PgdA/CDA1 family)
MSARQQIRDVIPSPARRVLYELTAPLRRRRWDRVPGVERVPADRGVVLTFDDGPDEKVTPRVMDALEGVGARGTFFVLGERVLEHPELTREIEERGHELALHGMTHYRHDALSAADAKVELTEGASALESTLGHRPRWYRPPFGRSSPELAAACGELDLELVYWTSWGHDWEPLSAARIAGKVGRDLSPGAIVLLHDSALYAERDDAQPTVDAIPIIAGSAREAGSALVTLGAAVSDPAG